MTQVELANQLGISPSYLDLIEHNRRTLGAELVVKIAAILPVDLNALSSSHDERLLAELLEAFGDPLCDSIDIITIITRDLQELAAPIQAPGAPCFISTRRTGACANSARVT